MLLQQWRPVAQYLHPRARHRPPRPASSASSGLTLVHISAQRERFVWNRGCIEGSFWGCL